MTMMILMIMMKMMMMEVVLMMMMVMSDDLDEGEECPVLPVPWQIVFDIFVGCLNIDDQ